MPITEKDALEVLGFDATKYDDTDAFREAVEGTWVKREAAHNDKDIAGKIVGKFNRVLKSKLGKVGKELGVEFDDSREALDLIDDLAPAITTTVGQVNEWKTKAEKGVGDDVVKEWQTKLKAAEKERDTFKSQAVDFQTRYDALNSEVVTNKRKAVVDAEWNAGLSGITFHSGVNELLKEGFVSKVRSKYKVEPDEDGKVHLLGADGNPIKHPKKAGELLTLAEALKEEAKAFKLLAENPHANRPAPQAQRHNSVPPQAPPQGVPQRTIPRRFGQGR